ncbi:unnamed protein product [Notodromas monacha]|uniref:Uncharacterized protein n=1 Tax=Notodromas monacha TaxID=399045 RepID=A0A7R9BQX5_9CRUS|nr:unnamed protein product [Notodromas monacha]CAG0918680.1 unnamed protein product [Notodromas monacha]
MLYSGSTLFSWLSEWSLLPLDQVNFLITQCVCLGAAFAFRRFLHPTKASPVLRLSVALSLGLALSYFCFGSICLVISLVYLSAIHLWRQWTDYGAYVIDITGPLMIMTQKVTSLAFSLHDGLAKSWNDLNPGQKRYAIKKKPGVLEFFGYVLNFQGVCAGPMVFYVDYQEFVTGRNFKIKEARSEQNGVSNGSRCIPALDEKTAEPTALIAVTSKVSASLLFALGFLFLGPVFEIKHLKDDSFFEASVVYRSFYVLMATTIARWKYYVAWILADAIANASGLGFAGYDESGLPRWDLISNVDLYGVEVGLSFHELIASWNKGTNRWLKMTVYERVPKFRTLSTYVLSAFWHGFYPGYYLTFVGGALFTLSSRAARRSIRPFFLSCEKKKLFYDAITTVTARLILAYITFSFVLLEFGPSIKVYKGFYFAPHIIGLGVMLLPFLLPTPRRDKGNTKKNS